MKKKILALVLTALMLLGLTACGPKSIEEVEGTVYECKQFTALCPEDWVNIPVMELNEDTVSPNHLRFCKYETKEGEEVGTAIISNAYINLDHYAKATEIYESKEIYKADTIEDITLEVNGTKWTGYTGELAYSKFAILWVEGSGEWQVKICLSDEDGDIEYDDMEIQVILASLKTK
ncbi:MAG: hypothetical protein IJL20_05565 [Lachnospiraceae bacterium]|nr:hypothetical protein [Lachnospiraceae bacterium]